MKRFLKRFRLTFQHWLLLGLCLALLWSCTGSIPQVDSFESAAKVLRENVLPKINVTESLIPDTVASQIAVEQVKEPLPKLEDFSLYGAQPTNDPQTVYLEIFSSAEKANAQKEGERWLVDVADAFNAKKVKTSSGQAIQVGIRNIPSGLGERLIAAKVAKPAAYTPSNALWIEILKSDGIIPIPIASKLLPNSAGFVVQSQVAQSLGGNPTFDSLLDSILAGKVTIGYPNPYTSAAALNLLYTIFWQSAGHQKDGKPLTVDDLKSPQVNSVFETFQKQVLTTTRTTLDLKDIFIRDQQKLQAFPLDYQSYVNLKKLPGFEQTVFVPFGVPQNSPLVGFNWNTNAQQEALKKFAEFATSPEVQRAAKAQGFEEINTSKDLPPIPSGQVLKEAQSFWKQKKDGGRTVYMSIVVDTSGSMEGERINLVKSGLKIATKQINAGNYVGLITFGDNPQRLVNMAPLDKLQQQRILAAVDSLIPDGSTAMYDAALVGLADLMEYKKKDPNGRFYLLLLTDGEVNRGFKLKEVKGIMEYSGVRIYPISYGKVNQQELEDIAALRESTVQAGNPKNIESLLKELFQTNL
jgi:Ca-activated chloride channel family protein